MKVMAADVQKFIEESDLRGGPNTVECMKYWEKFSYVRQAHVDENLDPFSDEYVEQQLSLYREISGRNFNQSINEHTRFDLEKHASAVNPYDHRRPGGLAIHMQRIAFAITSTAPPRDGLMLDMGCGWGLSSEVAAYCGLEVTAVDVNVDFVKLVQMRADRMGSKIVAKHGTFENFHSENLFDMVFFYECLHHALRPWSVLRRMARQIDSTGAITLAGEPVNSFWWKNWGLRLDPMSVYCIGKHGWFESGWSSQFLDKMIKVVGLRPEYFGSEESDLGLVTICRKSTKGLRSASSILRERQNSGWFDDKNYMTSQGFSQITFDFPDGSDCAVIKLCNFRGRSILLKVVANDSLLFDGELGLEPTFIEIDRMSTSTHLVFSGETWRPSEELQTSDVRCLSFHLESIEFR